MGNAAAVFDHSTHRKRLMYADGDTGDIIRVIMYADGRSNEFVTPRAVNLVQGPDQYHTLENIYWLVKKNIKYQADPAGSELVRSPGYLFDTRTGDCKSMSIAIAALCRACGISYRYRFIRQGARPNYHHVYVVATPTDGSSRDEVILDAVHRSFNSEPSYNKKLDLKPGQRIPAAVSGTGGGGAWMLLLLLVFWFANAKKVN